MAKEAFDITMNGSDSLLYITLITIDGFKSCQESQHTKNFWEDFKSLLRYKNKNNNNQYGLAHDPKKAFAGVATEQALISCNKFTKEIFSWPLV